ncbi:phosphotyrosine protein phosphatase [Micromonospora ureilytica]|uniref:protein-tyrosine-phosphatase n=1 Tax=Micromonospora ureilytica TaxID=709868 RepID=A0A3N9XPW4_9ACTN|nr:MULTISPECIES: phosphotyrosine protein phosphatase [Micromonospora]MBG6069919.1 protein-tyrosine phosphatase [Micromonospora ureilytica]MBQ1020378.1 phosphotyrosine protein phosphatase [Micromonospora sp. D93]RQX14839.1 phosphotyrosine protein phosphatase [Micromonospora ureilytica]WSG32982.1 phosphotyrosine protein phosphatase [Micromonospora ureilytica]WSR56854.1 phosphotyrosine protein phosphatase [Micromonospora ureilytica]
MPPFTVLHVCMGNICRSPMAERLLALAVRERLTRRAQDPAQAEELVHSHSAGTGGWHAGEEMNPPAARQVTGRGGEVEGFAARKLRSDHIDAADLVLTATADQQEYVVALRPDAAARTFVLGEFGRLLAAVDAAALPSGDATPEAVYARGVALVAAAHDARLGASALATDDLDDPWGRGDQCFSRVADEIEETVHPLAGALLP